jgi:putative FmdB family regulatory protein
MPTYEYQCDSCLHRFEVKQSIKDDPLSACERCGKAVRRLISSPGIMFKGSGWYVTDYSDKLKPPSSSGEGETTSKKTEEKKESTAPAATTPTTPASSPAPAAGSTSSTTTTTSSS